MFDQNGDNLSQTFFSFGKLRVCFVLAFNDLTRSLASPLSDLERVYLTSGTYIDVHPMPVPFLSSTTYLSLLSTSVLPRLLTPGSGHTKQEHRNHHNNQLRAAEFKASHSFRFAYRQNTILTLTFPSFRSIPLFSVFCIASRGILPRGEIGRRHKKASLHMSLPFS